MVSRQIHNVPTIWLVAFIILSTAPELRVGDVQILEMLQVIRAFLVAGLFAYAGLKVPSTGVWHEYGRGYVIFLAAALALSLVALRLPFYPPSDISFLKEPFVLSLARLLELSLVIYFMLAMADVLRDRPRLFRVALDVYIAAGTLSALASVIAFVVFQLTGQYTYLINGLDYRARGFFNEGGPYGLFLTSVILVFLMRRRIYRYVHRSIAWIALGITLIAWLLSFSKAGLLAAILCIAAAFLLSGMRKRIMAAILVPVALAGFFLLFERALAGYRGGLSDFDTAVLFRPEDRNLVMGRIVAVFVVPRMIAAHPILGIGVGNYSLMRNDPEYLQGLPVIDDWDLPGLGLISDAAELGLPLAIVLAFLMLRPLWRCRRAKAPTIVLAAAAFQPAALAMGVNLNFFYPWVVTAFVLAWLGRYQYVRTVVDRKVPARVPQVGAPRFSVS
jgi:hypothetical protein